MGYEVSVSLRPGYQRSRVFARLGNTQSEIKDAGPGAGVFHSGAIVVSAPVVDEQPQSWRRKILAIHPFRHRQLVKRCYLGVIRPCDSRNRECSAAFRVAPGDPSIDLSVKGLKLTFVFGGRSGVQV